MPKELEQKLKKQYGVRSDIPYKIMNKMGVLHPQKAMDKARESVLRRVKNEKRT